MKLSTFLLTLLGVALLLPANAQAYTFHFKASALFPVQQDIDDPKNTDPTATLVKKVSLGTKEIINLALGVPLDTKISKDVVLALVIDPDNDPSGGKLVVYDKHSKVDLATVVTLIDPLDTNTQTKDGEKGTGNGLSRGTISATTLGTPAQNGLLSTGICGAATGSKTPGEHGPTVKMSVTSIVGPLQAKIGGVLLDGLIIKGMFSAGGAPLDPL